MRSLFYITRRPIEVIFAVRTYAPYGGSVPIKRFIIAAFVVCKYRRKESAGSYAFLQAQQLLEIVMTVVLTAKTECELSYCQ